MNWALGHILVLQCRVTLGSGECTYCPAQWVWTWNQTGGGSNSGSAMCFFVTMSKSFICPETHFLISAVGTRASHTVVVKRDNSACPWAGTTLLLPFFNPLFLDFFPCLPGCPCGRPSTLTSLIFSPRPQCSGVTSCSSRLSVLLSGFSLPS